MSVTRRHHEAGQIRETLMNLLVQPIALTTRIPYQFFMPA